MMMVPCQHKKIDPCSRFPSGGGAWWYVDQCLECGLIRESGTTDPWFSTGDAFQKHMTRNEPAATSNASGTVASSILEEAAKIVAGARNATHGDKERSFQVIADLWNAYLAGRKTGGAVTPRDVAQMMVLLKIGRSIQGDAVRDHFVDQAGYSGIAGELAS